jgi:malic enzyme
VVYFVFDMDSSLTELPKEVQYLIVGAGTAAFAAYRAIRSADVKAKVPKSLFIPYIQRKLVILVMYSKLLIDHSVSKMSMSTYL